MPAHTLCTCSACETKGLRDHWSMSLMEFAVALIFLILLLCLAPAKVEANEMVRIAQSQIGKGEIYGDNKGPEVKKYTKGQEVAWCAAFVSWVRFRSGQSDNYFLAARSYWKNYGHKRVGVPRPGDLIVFSRGSKGGHIGIVEKVQGGTITTIEGNSGKFPAKVRRFTYKLGSIKNLLGFIRV